MVKTLEEQLDEERFGGKPAGKIIIEDSARIANPELVKAWYLCTFGGGPFWASVTKDKVGQEIICQLSGHQKHNAKPYESKQLVIKPKA